MSVTKPTQSKTVKPKSAKQKIARSKSAGAILANGSKTEASDYGEVLDETLYSKPAYPWNVWADGKARRLTRGTHFFCSTASFVSAANQCARRLRAAGRIVSVGCRINGDFVTIQFLYKDGKPVKSAEISEKP